MKRTSIYSGFYLTLGFLLLFGVNTAAYAQIGSDWIKCGDRTVAVEKTQFSGYGVDVYKGKTDQLLIVTDKGSDRARFCLLVVGGWKYVGFKQFAQHQGSDKKTVVFVISTDNVDRYFDIKNGNEVFVDTDEAGKPFISSATKSREKIFSR